MISTPWPVEWGEAEAGGQCPHSLHSNRVPSCFICWMAIEYVILLLKKFFRSLKTSDLAPNSFILKVGKLRLRERQVGLG